MNMSMLYLTATSHLVLFVLFVSIVQGRVIYVLPSHQSHTNCLVEDCYSLTDLINGHILSSNISNTTIALLPGTHTIINSAVKVVSINSAANFTMSASGLSAGAIIVCNGTNIGFVFSHTFNVTISGITIKQCGASEHFTFLPTHLETFTLFIAYSYNVTVTNVTIIAGKGTGLLVRGVHGHLYLLRNAFIMNNINLNINYDDSSNGARNDRLSDTVVIIKDSLFSHGHMLSPLCSNSSGISLIFLQETYLVTIWLTNITSHQNLNCHLCNNVNMYIVFDMCTTSVVIEDYFATYTNHLNIPQISCYDKGLELKLYLLTDSCDFTSVTTRNAHFNNCGIHISSTNIDYIDTTGIFLSNVIVKNSFNAIEMLGSLLMFELKNITIQDSNNDLGCVFFEDAHVTLLDFFAYKDNKGSFILLDSTLVVAEGSYVEFSHNSAAYIATLYVEMSNIHLKDDSITVFENNTGRHSGAIFLTKRSTVAFYGNPSITFSGNNGRKGGAIALTRESALEFYDGITNLLFKNNHADIVGGAIYARDFEYFTFQTWPNFTICPQYNFLVVSPSANPYFQFINNTADQAGSIQYGGGGSFSKQYYHYIESNFSLLSSQPVQVCICIKSIPDCNITNKNITIFPGQTFEVEAVAVGEAKGTAPSYVKSTFLSPSSGELLQNQRIQTVEKGCSKLTFTLKSSQKTEILQLTVDSNNPVFDICYEDYSLIQLQSVKLTIELKNCFVGFYYNKMFKQCLCHETLSEHGISCDLNTTTVLRVRLTWINATFNHLTKSKEIGFIVHDHCPFDYCISTQSYRSGVQPLNLLYPDEQCAFNRSSILCGACQTNFSHVLGTSKCKKCTKPWVAIIIPLIAIIGVALVLGLMFLNLTVSVGTINGLIFYANIVRANHAIFFPHQLSDSFLGMFIAWLNLDLGIEICFYDGLDAYVKTWFQFLFPLYIWFMVVAIIVASHYSTRISKLCGNNSVQVLATLFLLSYAKVLRIIITIFSSTLLVYPDGYRRRVWLYDGNVDYLKGKHIPLFIAAILLLTFLCIPYTIILLCIQWLQRSSNYKIFFWVGKLQPLFDAYTGPYKIKHRYWTGLLLLIRVCLYVVFTFNTLGDPQINILATVVAMSSLLAYSSVVGGVYKSWILNLINNSFILNLTILSAVSLYGISVDTSIKPVILTSAGIIFVLFAIIVVYHLTWKVIKPAPIVKKVISIKKKLKEQRVISQHSNISEQKNEVTCTTIELREPLMDL